MRRHFLSLARADERTGADGFHSPHVIAIDVVNLAIPVGVTALAAAPRRVLAAKPPAVARNLGDRHVPERALIVVRARALAARGDKGTERRLGRARSSTENHSGPWQAPGRRCRRDEDLGRLALCAHNDHRPPWRGCLRSDRARGVEPRRFWQIYVAQYAPARRIAR